MKIAIIGFGAASIGFIEKIVNSHHEFHIFEKSKDIYSSSISGIRADGKLFVSSEMGGDIAIDMNIQRQLVEFYLNKTLYINMLDILKLLSKEEDRTLKTVHQLYINYLA